MVDRVLLDRARKLRHRDSAADPFLLTDLRDIRDVATVAEVGRLLADVDARRVIPAHQNVRDIRVAITATFTTGSVAPLLRVALLEAGVDAQIHVSGFDQLSLDLTDPGSPLAAFSPDLTLCLLHDGALLPREWNPASADSLADALAERVSSIERAVPGFLARVPGFVLFNTVPLASTAARAVISYKGKARLGRLWRKVNDSLLDLAERYDRVHVIDLESLLVHHEGTMTDARLARFAAMAWTPSVEHLYARQTAKFCRALLGLAKKCLVLDLDNTLWGGVVGDDGIGGIQLGSLYPGNCYVEVQRAAKMLRQQGVLLAIASKNDAQNVDTVLRDHPDMVVRPEDFAASAVNWGPKDGNIRKLVKSLNIGLDSLVFADDSSFETDLVRSALPEVRVVRLHGDPAGYTDLLLDEGLFDVLATTATDAQRTELYRARAERENFAESFSTPEDYLRGLGLRVSVAPADEFSLPRIVQLGLRTHQFTMIRSPHSEARTRELAGSPGHLVLGFEASDRFGREGVVGAVWIQRGSPTWEIENFVMSCRVFSRGIEFAVLGHVIETALAEGAQRLAVPFERTDRNGPAARFLAEAGFREKTEADVGPLHVLDLATVRALHPDWITLERRSAHV